MTFYISTCDHRLVIFSPKLTLILGISGGKHVLAKGHVQTQAIVSAMTNLNNSINSHG